MNTLQADLTALSVSTIGCYTRLVEIHLQAIAEGASPVLGGKMKEMMDAVYEALPKEVEFLNFLRSNVHNQR